MPRSPFQARPAPSGLFSILVVRILGCLMGHNSVVRTPVASRSEEKSERLYLLRGWSLADVLGSWWTPTFDCGALSLFPKRFLTQDLKILFPITVLCPSRCAAGGPH